MTYGIAASGYHPTFDGVEYYSPLEAYWRTNYNAWNCFEQTGFSASAWAEKVYMPDVAD